MDQVNIQVSETVDLLFKGHSSKDPFHQSQQKALVYHLISIISFVTHQPTVSKADLLGYVQHPDAIAQLLDTALLSTQPDHPLSRTNPDLVQAARASITAIQKLPTVLAPATINQYYEEIAGVLS